MGTTKSGGVWTKMKVLYLGHYKESTGWSVAAINNILALDSVGIDVVCRDVKLTNKSVNIPDKIKELEQKDLHDVDICIQHVLPHHLTGTSKFRKNIAYLAYESTSIKNNPWYCNLQLMDEIWVPNSMLKENFENEDLKNIKVVPHAFDIFRYQTQYEKFDLKELNETFKFYCILDINDRKNIDSVLKCFLSEFQKDERVCLVVKVKKYGLDENALNNLVKNKADQIKKTLRIFNNPSSYPDIVIIGKELSNSDVNVLHNTCDCYVGTTHGEAWSIPAFEAMCFGKTPICGNEGGPREFIDKDNKSTGYLVDGNYNVCYHSDPAFGTIFTGREEWFFPSESETKKAMRYYYENRGSIDNIAGIKQGKKFSLENVGNTMKEYLND